MDEIQKSDAMAIDALRKKGYKATPQRIAICRFVLSSRDHPTAQKIYAEVKKIHPTVSLATVYKTLQVLQELNLLQELSFPNSQARFDSYMKPHINLICSQCGDIKDLDDGITQDLIQKVTKTAKFTTTKQRLDVYGTCQKCATGK
jgi:Fur family transcriptional regulator, peroxide stress response regulator